MFDDTDLSTLENGPAVYDVLTDHGIHITKSVWPVAPSGPPTTGGSTCAEPEYLDWVLTLKAAGHEIGYHNASDHSSTREQTIAALDRFNAIFGHDPRIGADHAGNLEAMYWGPARLTGLRSRLYGLGSRLMRPSREDKQGHIPTSPHFWGDVLRDRIDYWRNFTYTSTDTLAACPTLPYHDPARPYVNWWFASSHAPTMAPFLALLSPARLDRLEASGGACVLYTHFGADFTSNRQADPRFVAVIENLAQRNGWFAPASEVLDHLRRQRGNDEPLSGSQRRVLETRWITDQVRSRGLTEIGRAFKARRR